MIALLFSWCATIAMMILELIFGNCGFFVPLAGASILYFATTTSWKNALLLSIVIGLALDGIYARSLPLESCLLPAALLFNRRFMPETIKNSGVLSALVCGALYAFLLAFSSIFFVGKNAAIWQEIWGLPIIVAVWTFLFCLLIFGFDAIARRIGTLPYCAELDENATLYHGGRKVSQKTVTHERGVR
ncbi:MAG: hypothetical protein MJ033_00630 [Victivallaceae bacterium]|nr:hypothetical protein [Victivallaceae bacterium]